MRPRRPTIAISSTAVHAIACFVPLPLAIAIAIAIVGDATIVKANDASRAPGPQLEAPRGTDESVAWRPILAGCLGVGFGAAVAVWQIRGRSKHP